MYDELIRVLRHCGNPNVSCKGCFDEDDCIGADGAWEIGAMANMRAAAEAIEKLVATVGTAYNELANNEANKPRWIPVTERLPEEQQSVLVHRDDGGIFIFGYFTTSPTDECWIDDHLNVYSAYCITHWMPLPEPPKEE